MIRMLLAATAAVGMSLGAALAQTPPPPGGLTPGAPLGTDPYSGEGAVVGEETPRMTGQAFVERRPALLPQERPTFAEDRFLRPAFGLTPGAPTGEDTESGPRSVFGSVD